MGSFLSSGDAMKNVCEVLFPPSKEKSKHFFCWSQFKKVFFLSIILSFLEAPPKFRLLLRNGDDPGADLNGESLRRSRIDANRRFARQI